MTVANTPVSPGATDHDPVRPEPPTTYYDGAVKLPGFEAPPDRCRGLTPVGFCDHGHTILGQSSCGTRYCPDHWRDWCEDAVISMVARMAAYRQAVEGAERPASHVVASPPQDRRYSQREMWGTRSESYEALSETGVGGGPAITHPYRTSDRGDHLYETAVQAGEVEEDYGKWRFLREIAGDWGDMTRYVEAAPHYHVPIAPRRYVDGEDAPDGWVVKRLRKLRAFHLRDMESYRDMAASAYYVLTHGAAQQGKQTTTWFGEVHPSSFDPEKELTNSEWRQIQERAEKAVREDPSEEGGGGGAGPEECPRDGCEAAVKDLMYLGEYLDDEEWIEEVRQSGDGRARLAKLRGAYAWWQDRTDRPPPHVRGDEERMGNWLKNKGARYAKTRASSSTRQVGLGSELMS
jgi:hypothetical protein